MRVGVYSMLFKYANSFHQSCITNPSVTNTVWVSVSDQTVTQSPTFTTTKQIHILNINKFQKGQHGIDATLTPIILKKIGKTNTLQ